MLTAAKAELARYNYERIRDSLTEWSRTCGFEPAKHHQLVIDKLEAVERGETLRQMIFMPPGSAKSTYGSVLFPPWFMAKRYQAWLKDYQAGRTKAEAPKIIQASHTADMAERWSRRVRNLVAEYKDALGLSPRHDSQAAAHWETQQGTQYYAFGVGGNIAGQRCDLAIIDDPVKSSQEADSPTRRDSLWRWYLGDLLPRLTPGARIVFIMTRWHEDDLAGRLLNEGSIGGEHWDVLELPAQCERDGDPLGRQIGDYLWTDGTYGYGKLLGDMKAIQSPRNWSALYQQHPTPLEGGMFKNEWWKYEGAVPAGAKGVRRWDFAATEEEHKSADPDWTVGLRMWTFEGRYYIDDVVRFRGSPLAVDEALHNTATKDGVNIPIEIPLDPGSAGKADAEHKIRALAGWRITAEREAGKGDKAMRAGPFASQVQAGNVFLIKAPWNLAFVEELGTFPNGRHDDQVDAAAAAFMNLVMKPGDMHVTPEILAMQRMRRR